MSDRGRGQETQGDANLERREVKHKDGHLLREREQAGDWGLEGREL